jgi:hypothetical protein
MQPILPLGSLTPQFQTLRVLILRGLLFRIREHIVGVRSGKLHFYSILFAQIVRDSKMMLSRPETISGPELCALGKQ